MLVRGLKRYLHLAVPVLMVTIFALGIYSKRMLPEPWMRETTFSKDAAAPKANSNVNAVSKSATQKPVSPSAVDDVPPVALADWKEPIQTNAVVSPWQAAGPKDGELPDANPELKLHRVLKSVSMHDQRFFDIKFGDQDAINPNVIPHPSLEGVWIVVAQQQRSQVKNTVWFSEVVCNAEFRDGALQCIKPPMILPIPSTPEAHCEGEFFYFGFSIGPHDARLFYGPQFPMVMYGSLSAHTCFGQFLTDFRILYDWGAEFFDAAKFRQQTEVTRPPPYGFIEKNWFVFWDADGKIYVHHDLTPKRTFAALNDDGTTGPDLAPAVRKSDQKCMAKYIKPKIKGKETTHQATNSLEITLCKRSDTTCVPSDSNTILFSIFQRKIFYNWHTYYEPYVMAFQRRAPFGLVGLSMKPLWYEGRPRPNMQEPVEVDASVNVPVEPGSLLEYRMRKGHQMLYTTSISWLRPGQKYHGYLDDVLFIGFGIEDNSTAGTDVLAGDLFLDLGLCDGVVL